MNAEQPSLAQMAPPRKRPTLQLVDAGLVHAAGTPWQVPAVSGINLTLVAGDRVLIVGGNGSGKSTLLSLLSGLAVPTTGQCLLDGVPVSEQPKRVALLIQNTRLQLSRPTVSEELSEMAKRDADIPAVVAALDLAPLLTRRIDELSGGQQRRVGLAGALLRKADLVLLDEPLAGLDTRSAAGLLSALRVVPVNTIVVAVTHDPIATAPMLEGRNGRVLRIARGSVSEASLGEVSGAGGEPR